MKKFRLTDVEGNEFILEVPEMGECHVKLSPVEPPKPAEPEIKVGMWWWKSHDEKPHLICREENGFYYLGFGEDNTDSTGTIPYSKEMMLDGDRPATPAEIEAHLKKVCEKYVGSVRLNSTTINPEYSPNVLFEIDPDGFYDAINDRYIMSGVIVYQRGKFAEILPDKKKRPETREEFYEFLDDYIDRNCTRENFLDQYEL